MDLFLCQCVTGVSVASQGSTFHYTRWTNLLSPLVISQFGGKFPIGTLREANSSHLKLMIGRQAFLFGLGLCSVAMLIDLSVSGTLDVYIITCSILLIYKNWCTSAL